LAFVLLAALAAVELYASRVRRTDAAPRVDWSLLPIVVLIGGGYGLAFSLVARGLAGPRLAAWAVWLGAVVFAAGAALRVWSVAVLGRYFTYVVQVSPDQPVVEAGPYRLVRHPSYTGGLLMGAGIGLATGRLYAPLAIVGLNLAGYLIRIAFEERALAAAIGEPYRAYMARTKRLVPFLW
jgi:protein-S-isoprenylcysteine O-methyltransferase Ste14